MTRTDHPATTGRRRRWLHPLQSVRVRITLAAVLVTAVAVGTAGWLLVRSVEDAQIRDIRDDIDNYLDDVAYRLQAGEDPRSILDPEQKGPRVAELTVTDEDGNIVARYNDEGEEISKETSEENVNDDGEVVRPDSQLDGAPDDDTEVWMASVEAVTRTVETPDGRLTITAEAPIDEVARNVDNLTHRLRIGLPILVAMVGVIAWVLVGRALRPVEAIRAEVERITGSTMHRRVPEPPTSDEVGRLARTMNTMLGRLETSASEQRRFVADASHELRSPVAVIRAGLELARSQNDRDSWVNLVDGLLAEESRLESLLDDLLLLAAQDENGTTTRPTRSVDLAELASQEARRPRGVPVELVRTPSDAVTVAGDAEQLARALSNLVDNAARHASSIVHLSLTLDDDRVRLLIDDDGPGIPLQDRERVFERFTRLDDGRARHEGGTGLGLAVVRSIISSHNGTVHAADNSLGGARLLVEVPLVRTPGDQPSSDLISSP